MDQKTVFSKYYHHYFIIFAININFIIIISNNISVFFTIIITIIIIIIIIIIDFFTIKNQKGLKTFMPQNKVKMSTCSKLKILKFFFSFMQFLFKGEMWISLVKVIIFESEKKNIIFHIIDEIMVLRVPLLIGHCYLCMHGELFEIMVSDLRVPLQV